jgi:hypothetical protein
MIELKIDVTTLTKIEAETVAGFILALHKAGFDIEKKPSVDVHCSVDADKSQTAQEGIKAILAPPTSDAFPVVASFAVPAPPVAATHADLANGLPWDARIHSSAKTRTASGDWTRRRNVPDDVFQSVTAELKGIMSLPPAEGINMLDLFSDTPAPPLTVTPSEQANALLPMPFPSHLALPDAPVTSAPWPFDGEPPEPTHGVIVPPPAATPVAPADPISQFMDLVEKVQAACVAGKVSVTQIDAICQQHGIPTFGKLNMRLDLLPQIAPDIYKAVA